MDSSVYINAFVPEPFTILGLRLRPLSIGHLVLLHRLESPFVCEDSTSITIGDLALACLICSLDYASGIALLDNPILAVEIYRWGLRSANQHGWRRLCPWIRRPVDLKQKLDLFREYLTYSMEVPGYSVEEGKGKAIDAPAWQVVRMVLLSKTNLTDSEIMDRPYRLNMADFITLRAIEGHVDLVDNNEIEEARRMANEFAARLAEQRRGNGDS